MKRIAVAENTDNSTGRNMGKGMETQRVPKYVPAIQSKQDIPK